MILALKSKAAE